MNGAVNTRARQSGFTIVEAVVSIVIIGITAVAMTSALNLALSHSSDGLVQTKTARLAQSILDEVLARKYAESTPVGGVPPCAACGGIGPEGETRTAFDDVDDYDGLDETPPRDALGQILPDHQGYRVQVSVSFATTAQVAAWGLDAASDAKLIVVDITPPGEPPRRFSAIRANY